MKRDSTERYVPFPVYKAQKDRCKRQNNPPEMDTLPTSHPLLVAPGFQWAASLNWYNEAQQQVQSGDNDDGWEPHFTSLQPL